MDLDYYFLIEGAVDDRLGDLRRARRRTDLEVAPMSILYIASALRARPRAIDRYIDYFGDMVPHRR